MKRYKELKYDKKTFTEQWKIDEILVKKGFQWFLDCEVEDVRIEILKETLIMNSGTFFNGTWVYGAWRDGVWKYGTWMNGVWFNGRWLNGYFLDGIIKRGQFLNGRMEKGTVEGGDFYHFEISRDVKKKEKKKEEIQQDENPPQGEKITETIMKRNIKKFNEFKVNEEFEENLDEMGEKENLEETLPVDELPIDEVPDEKDLKVLPPKPVMTPAMRSEEWKTLSSNPGSRKIFRTMADYLTSIGITNTHMEDEPKVPTTRRGIRRKQ
jgi:hypothetical protein